MNSYIIKISSGLLGAFLIFSPAKAAVIIGAGVSGGDLVRPDDSIGVSTFNDLAFLMPSQLHIEAGTGTTNTLSAESFSATHDASTGGMTFGGWISANPQTNGYVMFDLGAQFDLSTIHIWQGAQTGNYNTGVNQFDILVSNDIAAFALGQENNVGWNEILANQTLSETPGTVAAGGPISAQDFSLGASTAQYIQIRIDSNHGGDYLTLSEVRFSTVPEPTVYALMVVAGALFVMTKRRRSS